jgi:hypothetical protein
MNCAQFDSGQPGPELPATKIRDGPNLSATLSFRSDQSKRARTTYVQHKTMTIPALRLTVFAPLRSNSRFRRSRSLRCNPDAQLFRVLSVFCGDIYPMNQSRHETETKANQLCNDLVSPSAPTRTGETKVKRKRINSETNPRRFRNIDTKTAKTARKSKKHFTKSSARRPHLEKPPASLKLLLGTCGLLFALGTAFIRPSAHPALFLGGIPVNIGSAAFIWIGK